MTDQQHPTSCKRCGGILDLCECAELRREGMMMAADFLDAQVKSPHGPAGQLIRDCGVAIRNLARKPGAPD